MIQEYEHYVEKCSHGCTYSKCCPPREDQGVFEVYIECPDDSYHQKMKATEQKLREDFNA